MVGSALAVPLDGVHLEEPDLIFQTAETVALVVEVRTVADDVLGEFYHLLIVLLLKLMIAPDSPKLLGQLLERFLVFADLLKYFRIDFLLLG